MFKKKVKINFFIDNDNKRVYTTHGINHIPRKTDIIRIHLTAYLVRNIYWNYIVNKKSKLVLKDVDVFLGRRD